MLAGLQVRQHIVEFIRGVGVVTDGVVDATSLNGPWAWTIPAGFGFTVDWCPGGNGGAGGGSPTGGGGGGGGTVAQLGRRLIARSGQAVTVTLGSGGVGGSAGSNGGLGGTSIIALSGGETWTFSQHGPAAISGGTTNGGTGGGVIYGTGATGGSGAVGSNFTAQSINYGPFSQFYSGAAGGGAVNFNGGSVYSQIKSLVGTVSDTNSLGGTGNSTNGGGGAGAVTPFGTGYGAYGGGGGSVGSTATNYGGGGGGGGGGAAGGNGAPGYVRITYCTLD